MYPLEGEYYQAEYQDLLLVLEDREPKLVQRLVFHRHWHEEAQ